MLREQGAKALEGIWDGKTTPLAHSMDFIETPTFTRLQAALLTDDEYAGLQQVLVENPEGVTLSRGVAEFGSCAMHCPGVARVVG